MTEHHVTRRVDGRRHQTWHYQASPGERATYAVASPSAAVCVPQAACLGRLARRRFNLILSLHGRWSRQDGYELKAHQQALASSLLQYAHCLVYVYAHTQTCRGDSLQANDDAMCAVLLFRNSRPRPRSWHCSSQKKTQTSSKPIMQ